VLEAARTSAPSVRAAALAKSPRLATASAAVAAPAARAEGDAGDGAVSGFLLRSAVVAGWPGMEVRGFADAAGTRPLPLLRLEAVSPSILLCLFSGRLAAVELREPAEALHFGVEEADGVLAKELRYASGDGTHAVGSFTGTSVAVPLRSADTRVVSVAALAASMQDLVWTSPRPAGARFTAAEFGLEMVEGVQVVDFRADG
jgi:hypothetical protein